MNLNSLFARVFISNFVSVFISNKLDQISPNVYKSQVSLQSIFWYFPFFSVRLYEILLVTRFQLLKAQFNAYNIKKSWLLLFNSDLCIKIKLYMYAFQCVSTHLLLHVLLHAQFKVKAERKKNSEKLTHSPSSCRCRHVRAK